jgi:hypothetical protein
MIVVKLMGGLGNQMFQYATAKQLSIKHNKELKLDKSFLLRRDFGEGFTYRNYDLDIFNINAEVIDNCILDDTYTVIVEPHNTPNLTHIIDNIDLNKNVYLNGFFQKEIYFKDIRNQLLEDFKINITDDNIKNLEKEILSSNSICVNIRRGDYVNNNFHGFHGNEYINKSVLEIIKTVGNPIFYIFSDEIDWCIENIKIDFPHFFVDYNFKGDRFSSYLKLMSSCKHFIIPNSTFAWWAAWLNKDNEKIVYTPKNWFNVQHMDTEGLIPNEWNKI